MAEAADAAFAHGEILLAEAPTGVGKSLAYLVPALKWLFDNPDEHRQVIVSSHTKVLQEQLFRKDFRDLNRAMENIFNAAVLKGRNNYLCQRRLQLLLAEAEECLSENDRIHILPVLRWAATTSTGDVSEISGFSPRHQPYLWSLIASDGLSCSGSNCSAAKGDFYRIAQDAAAKAPLLFINHALLASDPSRFVGSPEKRLILDEAHQVERAMVAALTVEISAARLRNALARLADERSSRGLLSQLLVKYLQNIPAAAATAHQISGAVRGLYAVIRHTFGALADNLQQLMSAEDRSLKVMLKPGDRVHHTIGEGLSPLLVQWCEFALLLQEFERDLADQRGDDKLPMDRLVEWRSIREAIAAIGEDISDILECTNDNSVFWLELSRGNQNSWCTLYKAPISIGEILHKSFWPSVSGAVLTSATMTVDRRFDVLRESLGLNGEDTQRISEIMVGSPFNLADQMICCVPAYLPDPRKDSVGHTEALLRLIQNVLENSVRGTLLLCTSNDLLEKITSSTAHLAKRQQRKLLSQWSGGSLPDMVEEFKKAGNAIMIGAASLWEGIDVVGDALQILLVTRLPFDVPTDPWFAARCDALQNAGHDPFQDYSLPWASLRLRQGMGRLIRHVEDRGVVIIADPRLFTTRYGYSLRKSLPVTPMALHSAEELLDRIELFFQEA
jgi:ATP-dependent DNA helicase DinG